MWRVIISDNSIHRFKKLTLKSITDFTTTDFTDTDFPNTYFIITDFVTTDFTTINIIMRYNLDFTPSTSPNKKI